MRFTAAKSQRFQYLRVFGKDSIAAVALAAKNARIEWGLLANERNYQSDYVAKRAAA
jgi:hypothetical protein